MLETGPARSTALPSAGRRGLPGPVLAGCYVIAAIAPLGAALISGVEPGGLWLELGTALALVAAALLLLQFLSSGRLEVLSGAIGIDRTMGFHRIAALTLLLLAVLHPLSYVAGTLVHEPATGFSRLLDMLARPRLRSGVMALAILLAIVALAVVRHRRLLRYETWRASHGLMACAAAGFTLHHALAAGTYSAELEMRALWLAYGGAALAAILLTYVVRPWRMWRGGWIVESSRQAAESVTELILKAPDETDFSFRGGQFVWLTIAPNRPPFHDHPFSIASSGAQLPRLRLLVRHAGDCTNRFGVIAPGTPVAVDGPHGSFVLPEAPSTIAMIAGGVGIAPCLGMLEEAAARGDRRAFRLVYAARCNAALAALERLRELQSRLDLTILTIVDEPSTEPAHIQGPLQPEHVARALEGADTRTLAALVCGPPRMMELVTDELLARGVAPSSIHYERFDYAAGRGQLDRWRRNRALGVLAVIAAAILAFASR